MWAVYVMKETNVYMILDIYTSYIAVISKMGQKEGNEIQGVQGLCNYWDDVLISFFIWKKFKKEYNLYVYKKYIQMHLIVVCNLVVICWISWIQDILAHQFL